jgi:hypothetical protein
MITAASIVGDSNDLVSIAQGVSLRTFARRQASSPVFSPRAALVVARSIIPVLLMVPVLATAQTRDHLQCFKIKDNLAKQAYTADLTTDTGKREYERHLHAVVLVRKEWPAGPRSPRDLSAHPRGPWPADHRRVLLL